MGVCVRGVRPCLECVLFCVCLYACGGGAEGLVWSMCLCAWCVWIGGTGAGLPSPTKAAQVQHPEGRTCLCVRACGRACMRVLRAAFSPVSTSPY